MHLISIVIYNLTGEMREIRFHAGLNIVTGNSATGKSALLDMVEYCLGRDTLIIPVGPITDTVVWYGLLIQLDHQQAFVGRPRPDPGRLSNQRAMLEFGVDLQAPQFSALIVNCDTTAVREQLGRSIGIDENLTDGVGGSLSFDANLGHAVLLCMQRQSEIANRDFLFHRQGEEGMHRAIQETLPYFIGAVGRDRAILRQQLLVAKRALRDTEAQLQLAEAADEQLTVNVRGLLAEAIAASLIDRDIPDGSVAALSALAQVVTTRVSEVPLDDDEAVERQRLMRRRDDLRQSLRQAGENRGILEALERDEAQFEGVVGQQISRLRSLELVGNHADEETTECPICGTRLAEPDPTLGELMQAATHLKAQAGSFGLAKPRRLQALEAVRDQSERIRSEIHGVQEAIDALEATRRATNTGRTFAERQAFLQGRIQHYLETASRTDAQALDALRDRVRLRGLAVAQLEMQLDPDEEREQLLSRLAIIGQDMTTWAQILALEHTGSGVRLDLKRLTVVADTSSGPAALMRIGAAGNWIGYHLVAHLGLHKYFIDQDRPVPHFLMLDQLTQAYYPSDVDREAGIPVKDNDRTAVHQLFELIATVVQGLDNSLQVIVCDHANLPDKWFQESIIANWRNGERLIPDDWIALA